MHELTEQLVKRLFVDTGVTIAFFGLLFSLSLLLGSTAIQIGTWMWDRRGEKQSLYKNDSMGEI